MIERKTVLIVIAGPNGSGKTSITKKILHHEWMEDAIYIKSRYYRSRKIWRLEFS